MISVHDEIRKITGASEISDEKSIQSLWSGYGEIRKYFLKDGKYGSIIVKHIHWSDGKKHPKGWNTQRSHHRKLKSYQVEKNWYQQFAQETNEQCRVPKSYMTMEEESEMLLIMEDLDAAGFHIRISPESVSLKNAKSCLSWLAHFHAKFIGVSAEGLWPFGTYWHLATRPDELEQMGNVPLKHVAKEIDDHLNTAKYQTLVHGDAKLANFCFSEGGAVAAVDFQYVGKGCGMKDVAYLISSCFDEPTCEKYEGELLNYYFEQIKTALDESINYEELKEEWLSMYKYAWADFYRFLDGWSPGHWKIHGYSKRITREIIAELTNQ